MRWCATACTLSSPVTPATRHWASSDGGAASASAAGGGARRSGERDESVCRGDDGDEVVAARAVGHGERGDDGRARLERRAERAVGAPDGERSGAAAGRPPHEQRAVDADAAGAEAAERRAAARGERRRAVGVEVDDRDLPVAVVSASVLSELPPTSAPSLICVHCESSPSPSHDGAMPSNGSGMHDVPTWSAPSSSSQHGSDGSSNGSENVDWMLRCSHHVAGASVRKSRSYVSSSRSAQSADCSTKAEGDSHQAGADCAVPAKIAASKTARLIVSVNTACVSSSSEVAAAATPGAARLHVTTRLQHVGAGNGHEGEAAAEGDWMWTTA